MSEPTVLVLGGYGRAGSAIVRLLLEHSTARVVIGGRNADRAQSEATRLGSEFPNRVRGIWADTADPDLLRQETFGGIDIAVIASPTVACAEEVARAALACGVDYLDIQYSSKKWARLRPFQERIRQAGRCFITEAGLLPGLPSALSRIAAVDFESTDTARVELCIQPDPAKPLTNEVLAELVEELRDYEASVLQDGQWKKTRIGRPAEADFGHPLGKRRVFPIGLEEMRGLPGALPGLRDASCSIAGMNWFVDWMLMPLIPLSYRLKKGAPQRMPRLLGWGLRQFATAPYGAAAQVHVLGRRGGAPGERHVQVYHPDEYALTAAPVAACLLQYLDGSARKPGLWCMGHLVEPRRFASDLQRMGIELTTRDGVSARVTAGF